MNVETTDVSRRKTMKNIQLNDAQEKAVSARNKNILVSASAGTGKTFVMVERIISLIKEGHDISSFLVLTFAKDAAREMKERIEKSLYNLSALSPKYKPQLQKLKTANISTIHAFGSEMLKRYFHIACVSPKFKIEETAMIDVHKAEVMERLFLKKYQDHDEKFLEISEYFVEGRKDEQLKKIILKIHTMSRNMPVGEFENNFISSINEGGFEKYYIEIVKQNVQSLLYKLEKITPLPSFEPFYIQTKQILESIIESKDLSALKESISQKFKTKRIAKDDFIAQSEYFFEHREYIKESLKKFSAPLLSSLSGDEYIESYLKIARNLFSLTKEFEKNFQEFKNKKDIVEFVDLEHYLLEILQDENAKNQLRERFTFVFCDEYQDVSKLQEEILKNISRNLFAVGDVKQSIYGFRACDETNIIARESHIINNQNDGVLVHMNTNFRSSAVILDFVNIIFSVAMQNKNICEYEKNSLFIPFGETLGDVEIALCEKFSQAQNQETPEFYSVMNDTLQREEKERIKKCNELDENSSKDCEKKDYDSLEIEYAISYIKNNVGKDFDFTSGNRLTRFSDFAILLRSTTDEFALKLHKMLLEYSIPSFVIASESKLESHNNLLFLVDFLKAIDNPFQDIPLYSLLKSGFFSFTDELLFYIKNQSENKFFYQCFFSFARKIAEKYKLPLKRKNDNIEKPENAENIDYTSTDVFSFDFSHASNLSFEEEKVSSFMNDFSKYQILSLVSTSYLLEVSLEEKNIYSKVLCEQGEKESDFFKEIVSFIKSFDDCSLSYAVEKLEKALSSIKLKEEEKSYNAVKIMTIHKSKGLEFPFCILMNTNKKYNEMDNRQVILYDKNFGIAFDHRIIEERKTFVTIEKLAMKELKKRQLREEELRILYVALTRGKHRLLVTGTLDKPFSTSGKVIASPEIKEMVHPVDIYSNKSFLQVILSCLASSKFTSKYNLVRIEKTHIKMEREVLYFENSVIEMEEYMKRENDLLNLPMKTTATSRIFHKMIDVENFERQEKFHQNTENLSNISSMEIGTAYHRICELIPFFLSKIEIEKFVGKMIDNDDIPNLEYSYEKIYKLTNNELFKNATTYREVPFVLSVSSRLFEFDSDENILCQGIIDCVFEKENGEIFIVDYKATSIRNRQILKDKYEKQIEIYKIAVEKILHKKVTDCYIYSIFTESLISVL